MFATTVAVTVAWLLVGAAPAPAVPSADGAPRDTVLEGMATGSVSAGSDHTCGVRTNGTTACWGDNVMGAATPPSGTFTQVTVESMHGCAVSTTSTVACWGFNNTGQAPSA